MTRLKKNVKTAIMTGIILTATNVMAADNLKEDKAILEEKRGVPYEMPKAEEPKNRFITLPKISDSVELSGLIEVEAFSLSRDKGGDDESDVTLATVELGFDVKLNEWVNGHLLLLYEEDDTEPMDVDEAFITIGNTEKNPFYVKGGKMYIPFGKFESNMISDPLTLELAETSQSALQVGFEYQGFYGGVYAFNGDVEKNDNDNQVDKFGFNLGYAFEKEEMNFDIGMGWLNNILDTDSYEGWVDEFKAFAEEEDMKYKLDGYSSGFALYADLTYKGFNVIGEYIAQLDELEWKRYDISTGEKLSKAKQPKISAWNLEAAYTMPIMEKDTTFALSYQGTNDAQDVLPENRYLGSVGVGIFDGTILKFEYCRNEFETETDEDIITAQIAIEF